MHVSWKPTSPRAHKRESTRESTKITWLRRGLFNSLESRIHSCAQAPDTPMNILDPKSRRQRVEQAREVAVATEVQSKREVIQKAQKEGRTHLETLMDLCHLKNSELEQRVLRCVQGSSASQMTAAKVLDVIARLLGCAGKASDAVSDYTQVKMEDAPPLLRRWVP